MQWISTNLLALTLVAAMAAGACVDEPEHGEQTTALTKSVTFVDCTKPEKSKLYNVLDFLNERLESPEFLQCMRSTYRTYAPHGVMVEDLIEMLKVRDTTIICRDGGAPGSAGVPPLYGDTQPNPDLAPEIMSIETGYLMALPEEYVAATVVHEASHSLGFSHTGDASNDSIAYVAGTPVQLAKCMTHLLPDGRGRNATDGDNEMAPVGGRGAQPFSLRCPAGTTVQGVQGSTSSTAVNRLRLRCSDGTYTAYAGTFADSTLTLDANCGDSNSMVGFAGYADSQVRQLIGKCAPNYQIAADADPPSLANNTIGGGPVGTQFERYCPIGMAVVGVLGRAGTRIDQLRWQCEDIDGVRLANPVLAPGGFWRGAMSGTAKHGECSGHGAIYGIYGHAGNEIVNLGAQCYSVDIDPNTDLPSIPNAPVDNPNLRARRHGFEYNGGESPPAFAQRCPDGMLMVGLRVRSGARIDGIAGLCMKPETRASGSGAVERLPMLGGGGGVYSELTCPGRQFLTGLKVWADWTAAYNVKTVHGLQLVCRDLRPQGCATSISVWERFGGTMTGCAGSVRWQDRDTLCAPGYSACTPQEWKDNRDLQEPSHNYWTDTDLRYGGRSYACWASESYGYACNEPMRVCKPGGDDDWDGDGVQDNDCNWSNCGLETTFPNEYFGGCSGDTTAGTLCCKH